MISKDPTTDTIHWLHFYLNCVSVTFHVETLSNRSSISPRCSVGIIGPRKPKSYPSALIWMTNHSVVNIDPTPVLL